MIVPRRPKDTIYIVVYPFSRWYHEVSKVRPAYGSQPKSEENESVKLTRDITRRVCVERTRRG